MSRTRRISKEASKKYSTRKKAAIISMERQSSCMNYGVSPQEILLNGQIIKPYTVISFRTNDYIEFNAVDSESNQFYTFESSEHAVEFVKLVREVEYLTP